MRTLALLIEYDGTQYAGWQRQRNAIGIQTIVETAVRRLTREQNIVCGASRTDAGVHAAGQVAHVQTRTTIPPQALVRGTAVHLPPDISIRDAVEVAPTFHARKDAISKYYRYLIYEHPVAHSVLRRRCWWRVGRLQLRAMQRAARHCVGEHDFAAFSASQHGRQSTVRTVRRLTLRRVHAARAWPLLQPVAGDIIIIDVVGTGFLKHMVRNLVGTLVEVGEGRRTPASVLATLRSRDRRQAGPCAPAGGLTLVTVTYPRKIFK